MEYRKMVMKTLYARQQKRHRCKEQTFGLCGRRQRWDDLREQHCNMYIIVRELDHQSRFDAWDRVLRAGALGCPWGMGWGGKWEGVSGWGTHVHPWLIRVNVWGKPLHYCKVVSLQLNKVIKKKMYPEAGHWMSLLSSCISSIIDEYSRPAPTSGRLLLSILLTRFLERGN